MNHREYVAQREARDPEYRAARAARHSLFEVHRAVIGARVRAGLTQQQLADRLGVSQSAIARWEGGSTMPSLENLNRLAVALGVSFMTGPDVMLSSRSPREIAVEYLESPEGRELLRSMVPEATMEAARVPAAPREADGISTSERATVGSAGVATRGTQTAEVREYHQTNREEPAMPEGSTAWAAHAKDRRLPRRM